MKKKIITLDIDKIDFDDKDATKELFRKLLNFIEYRAQVIRLQNEIIQQQGDEIAKIKRFEGQTKDRAKHPLSGTKTSIIREAKEVVEGFEGLVRYRVRYLAAGCCISWVRTCNNPKYQAIDR